jgi:NADH:ubiquinone oxidoreductase subunit 6 (subunit J)
MKFIQTFIVFYYIGAIFSTIITIVGFIRNRKGIKEQAKEVEEMFNKNISDIIIALTAILMATGSWILVVYTLLGINASEDDNEEEL